MVEPRIGIIHGRLILQAVPDRGVLITCVAVNQERHHSRQIGLGPRQPILQRQKVRAHVLCRAGDKPQQAGQAPQHRHLLRTGGAACLVTAATKTLQQRHRAGRFFVHTEFTHTGEPHNLGGRHTADHGVTLFTPV